MKKILSMMLSLVLLLNLNITVFAEEDTIASTSDAQAVTGQSIIGTSIICLNDQPEIVSDSDEESTITIDITWGAMNFTYSDEQVDGSDKGWTCETGANTVKVENKGTESIVAGISYKQADDYTAISGTFDKASETIEKDDNATFTLTLSGKPDAALSGAEIGSVTVTIVNADTGTTTATIADENGDEPAEGVNESEDSNAALDEETNGTDAVIDTDENGGEPAEGAETESENLNPVLDEESNGTETATETEENSEDGDEPDEGANETEDSNAALDEEPNGDEIMTDTGDDVENGDETAEGTETESENLNSALDEEPNGDETEADTEEDEEESIEIGDEGQTIK